jgi:hypothetical protein
MSKNCRNGGVEGSDVEVNQMCLASRKTYAKDSDTVDDRIGSSVKEAERDRRDRVGRNVIRFNK